MPYLLIVGEKEEGDQEVSVRKQGGEDKGSMKLSTFADEVTREVTKMMNPQLFNE